MWEALERLFGPGFMPHGHCYLWTPSMVWTQVSSNLLIGLSYVSIAATLAVLVRRIRHMLPFRWAFLAFGTFILSCGMTHFLDVVTVWHPIYWVDAGVRVLTALASAGTALLILPLVSRAEALADASTLADQRGRALAKAHRDLEEAHRELEIANAALESANAALAKRAETKELEFRELFDNLPDLAWTALPDGHVDVYNRRWFEFTGMTPEQMEGWGWKDVHDPDILPEVVQRWEQALRTGEPLEMEFPLRGADGVYRWFLTRVRPLRDGEGRILRWFGSNTDIDERRRAREELAVSLERERGSRREAEEATRLKDEFLAAVSHELRTPLNAIVGWSRMLAAGQLPPERLPQALTTIERNALAQVQLVDDLLDISRIIAGTLRLEVQLVNLRHVVENAIESLRPAIEAKGLRVQIVVDSQANDIVGDAARLQQVAWNLVGNAVKFSDKDGRITVTLAAVNSHVELIVRDWGKGIKHDFLPYVFDRFRQADGSTTRAYGGLGLGLAITKQIVELHGGTISAASDGEGQGATFVVALARGGGVLGSRGDSSSHPTARVPVKLSVAPELRGARILVVDDEEGSRTLVKVALESAGAVVEMAGSAREALIAIETFGPDVVLSDIGMPEEDGFAFIAKARALPSMQKIPVAALTAFARAEDRRRALEAGFQMHLAKPIEPGELIAAVANLVRIRRAMLAG